MTELQAFLPEGLGLGVALVLLITTGIGSFITAAFGIGGGILVLAVMASLLPPAVLIPVHGLVQLGSNTSRFYFLRHAVHWALVPGFLIGSLLGIALGGQLMVSLPPALVQLAIGLFILWTLMGKPPRWLSRFSWLIGTLSSFLTMFFGATGPFVASYVRAQQLNPQAHVATHALLMVLQHGLKVGMFGLLGFAFGPWIALLVALLACATLGSWLGKQVLVRLQGDLFQRLLSLLLGIIALRLILASLWALWQG